MARSPSPLLPLEAGAPLELDFSAPAGDDFDALSRDVTPVRSMEARDLAKLIDIDRRITGRDRTGYFRQKLDEALHQSGVRVSLVAESEGYVAGFIMARVDFGDYGHVEPEAVIDTIGVDPNYARKGIGRALVSQLVANLAGLRVERIRTHVAWNDLALIGFLARAGFAPSQRLVLRRRVAAA
jgi:ribosomal protein S18 acetylase RimI-like enzyme